jgi:hypothetical protein
VTTTPLTFLRAANPRKRRQSRSCAIHDRARVSAGRSVCRGLLGVPEPRPQGPHGTAGPFCMTFEYPARMATAGTWPSTLKSSARGSR